MSEHLNAKIGGVPNTKIHIRNIPPHITETHLRSILGNVAYIKDMCYFNKNKKQMNMYPNNKIYNTALITFNTHEEAVNILQNIQNLIDSSGEEKSIEAKFAIPSNVINNNNHNNNNIMNSGNLFSRNNYGLPYHNNNNTNTTNNNVNSFSDNYNDSSSNNNANNNSTNNNSNGGNYANGDNSMINENGAVAGTNSSNYLNRNVRQRNNNNNNSNVMGGIGNKQMNALNSNGMNATNYNMFMKYNNNNRKNDSTQGMGIENETNNMNSSIRQHSYQPNCFQSNGGNSSNNNNGMNNNTNNMSNMTNVNPVNNGCTSASNNVGLYSGGDSFLWDNENEKNVDGLSLWESYKDSNNNIYYYNNLTKHSQWKKPIHPSKLFQYNSMEKVKQNGPQGSNLFIFHIPSEWNDVDLFEHFCCFGNIISSKIQRDSTGRNSGFGFVSYDNTVSAQRAIQHMNGYFVNNKYLKVQLKKGEVVNEAQA